MGFWKRSSPFDSHALPRGSGAVSTVSKKPLLAALLALDRPGEPQSTDFSHRVHCLEYQHPDIASQLSHVLREVSIRPRTLKLAGVTNKNELDWKVPIAKGFDNIVSSSWIYGIERN